MFKARGARQLRAAIPPLTPQDPSTRIAKRGGLRGRPDGTEGAA
nr:hypothetical protein RVX_3159 [Nitratidesulfovibrio sp. HK-II]